MINTRFNLLLAILGTLLLTSFRSFGQDTQKNIVKEKFHFNKQAEQELGYAQAIKVGNTIYISGTVSTGDMAAQVKQVYERLQKTLEHYGAGFNHVVKENVFTTDLEEFKKYKDVRKSFYKNDYPAATWIEIKRLFVADFKLEVELIAVLP